MFYNASINDLAVPVGAEVIQAGACGGMGSQENPYRLICPAGFEPQPDVEDGVEIVDPNGKWIQWKGGYFIVCPMGDANGDGRVTVADVMLAVNKVLGKPVSNFIMLASDMNKDGMITVADILLIEMCLSLQQHQQFVLDLVGHADAAKDEAAVPCCHLLGTKGGKHFLKLLGFFVGIVVTAASGKGVEFFVLKIFNGFYRCLHHAHLLATRVAAVTGVA